MSQGNIQDRIEAAKAHHLHLIHMRHETLIHAAVSLGPASWTKRFTSQQWRFGSSGNLELVQEWQPSLQALISFLSRLVARVVTWSR